MWRVGFWALVAMWAYCLVTHLLTAAGWSPPRIPAMVAAAIGVAVLWIGYWPVRRTFDAEPNDAWPRLVVAVFVVSFVCTLWPMVVGSGVPNTNIFVSLFKDSGVPS